jgi:hypothetical protein
MKNKGKCSLSEIYSDYIELQRKFTQKDPSRTYSNITGDIGELFACEHYGLKKSQTRGADAINESKELIEIKTRTNMDGKIEIKKDAKADKLLVLYLDEGGVFHEVYFGSLKVFFLNAQFKERTNDYQLSMKKLNELNQSSPAFGQAA